jgi:flagellar protein FliS
MTMYGMQNGVRAALGEYRSAGVLAEVSEASPHRLIQMLFEGALERLVRARGMMLQGDLKGKAESISKAINIITGLQSHLNLEQGGELARNLDGLYDYMGRRLVEGNLRNDPEILDEVMRLLREVKSGWDAVPSRLEAQPAEARTG